MICYVIINTLKSPMYICSLDAEKCFDSLWHDSLFYKLQAYSPDVLWRFLYKWYCNLTAVIKWNGQVHTNSYLMFLEVPGKVVCCLHTYLICSYPTYMNWIV